MGTLKESRLTHLTKTYYGSPGLSSITDSSIAYVDILMVSREGKVYRSIDGTPDTGSQDFLYDASRGKILFDPDNPFRDPGVPGRVNRYLLERVIVIYKMI